MAECFLEKKATGCKIPLSSYWDRIPAETKLEASVSRITSRVQLNGFKTGALVKAFFRASMASWQVGVY